MEKLKSKATNIDLANDDRSPSEISLQIDDSLDVEPFHYKPFRKLDGDAKKSAEEKLHRLHLWHKTDFVLLMYGFMNNNKIDLSTITEKDLDSRADTVSWYDFKSMSIYSGVNKHEYTRKEVNEAAERLTCYYPEQGIGPFTAKHPDGTYRLIDPEHMEYTMLYYYGHSNMCMLVRVVPWQAMFLNIIPWDMEPIHQPVGFRRDRFDQMKMENRDCMLASKRMLQDILGGFVNDMATSPFFYSHRFKKEFFKFIKEEGDLNEVFLAVDKFSKPGQPKTFLYCIVANAKPNMNFLDQVLTRFMESKLSDKEKNLQLVATCAAACRWGHILIYEKLCGMIKKPIFEMLRKAVVGGNVDIMHGILRDYNWSENETRAAMEWACFLGLDGMVRELQNYGVRFSDRCLYDAAYGGNMGLFFEICSGCDLEMAFKGGQTVLHVAAERGHLSIVEFLVHRGGVNVNTENSKRETALHLALKNGHVEVADILLDGDPNTDIQDASGSTPLHKACALGNMKLVERILATGCATNPLDNTGRSVLHKAAFGGSLDVVHRLCQLGNKLDVLDKNGSSSVHYASIQGHFHIVEYIVNEFPALIAQGNDKRWNPIACAAFGGHFALLNFLTRNRAGILVVTKSGKNAKQLAVEGLALKESDVEYYMEQFAEYVSFGSSASFNQVIELLADVERQIESKESDY
ncbi:ankyrin repeat domain-containing protein 50-like [Pecten maximus]|uniref:ankyrin repeat domain-containing protein 50-like n=1 Tax=Pecten maximus TaxID=6579 RepID=UPI00145897C4|nr:ankyrin repeat domain-containing protein 50-like [Pecten maximus]XP_033750036.1 ankyrin repeat domain-containing protein 50-like [Pecten maximus]